MDNLNSTLSGYKNTINERFGPVQEYLISHLKYIILFLVSFILLFTYFKVFFRRVSRALRPLKEYTKKLNLEPISANKEIMKGQFKLCDFYIASSHKSYLPYTQYWDYSSIDAIETVIKAGARYIELDIFPEGFCYDSQPVVCFGEAVGYYNYTTKLCFEKCMNRIQQWAFHAHLSNNTDPFFLFLNITCDNNIRLLDKIAKIIGKYMEGRLLDTNYNWRKTNLAQIPIKELMSKMIIISNSTWEGSPMEEYVNFSPEMSFYRNLSNIQVANNLDQKELTDFNRQNLTRVYPLFKERESTNLNPAMSWLNGSQFVCMNYQNMDNMMMLYLETFKNASIVLKPERLRYKPITYSDPIKQNPVVSFAPIQKTTPLYSITY